jgi:hypothetical protein
LRYIIPRLLGDIFPSLLNFISISHTPPPPPTPPVHFTLEKVINIWKLSLSPMAKGIYSLSSMLPMDIFLMLFEVQHVA